MTKKELSQLYYLKREIENDKERLCKVREIVANPISITLIASTRTGSRENRLERYKAEIVELEEIISEKITQSINECIRLERYIADIPNSYLRLIFTLRFINGLSWNRVALKLDGGTADSARYACDRYIKDTNKQKTVKCIDCKYLMFSDMYGECSKDYKGIVSPDDSCGKGVYNKTQEKR